MPAALDAHLGYWLRAVSNAVSHTFARAVEGQGVTVAEWVVLRELFDAPAAPSRLAQKLGLTRGAVTKLADRLIAKALITRAADAGDGRAQILSLTVAGRALVPGLAALADANDAHFFSHLSAAERSAFEATLKIIAARRGVTQTPVD